MGMSSNGPDGGANFMQIFSFMRQALVRPLYVLFLLVQNKYVKIFGKISTILLQL